jgi:hypothetical protein
VSGAGSSFFGAAETIEPSENVITAIKFIIIAFFTFSSFLFKQIFLEDDWLASSSSNKLFLFSPPQQTQVYISNFFPY